MTTREQYKSRCQQLESELQRVKEAEIKAYESLPNVPHESKEFQDAYEEYLKNVCRPNIEKKKALNKELLTCRIRSLGKFYCNRHLYSDIQPYEVIEVLSDTRLKLRRMNYVQTNGSVERLRRSFEPSGFCGHFDNSVQEWICTPDEKGIVVEVRQRKDGHFYEANDSIPYVLCDEPRRYRDFNF